MMDGIRALVLCLALGLSQMLLLGAWLWQAGAQAPLWLRLATALVLAATAVLCVALAMRLRRLLLWRRRRSVRPSREVQAERRRIAADLHDGVGALLVHAMALLEPRGDGARQVQGLLEQALLDLRMMVDSMDAMDDVLPVRLARLRHRLQPVLDRRGMRMQWEVADLQAGGDAGAPQGLPRGLAAQHLVAIVQEAVSNVLQHAQARTLWLVLAPVAGQGGAWELRVEDDGCGMAHWPEDLTAAGVRQGLGLEGMQRRARAMGASLALQARAGGGTVVRVRW
jgi:signal transduction histidine kinase